MLYTYRYYYLYMYILKYYFSLSVDIQHTTSSSIPYKLTTHTDRSFLFCRSLVLLTSDHNSLPRQILASIQLELQENSIIMKLNDESKSALKTWMRKELRNM